MHPKPGNSPATTGLLLITTRFTPDSVALHPGYTPVEELLQNKSPTPHLRHLGRRQCCKQWADPTFRGIRGAVSTSHAQHPPAHARHSISTMAGSLFHLPCNDDAISPSCFPRKTNSALPCFRRTQFNARCIWEIPASRPTRRRLPGKSIKQMPMSMVSSP